MLLDLTMAIDVKDKILDVTDTFVDIADMVTEHNNQLFQNQDTSGNQEKESAYLNGPPLVQVYLDITHPTNSNSTNFWIYNFSKLKNEIFNKHLFRPHPSLINFGQISRTIKKQEPTHTNSEENSQINISTPDLNINLGLKEIKQQISRIYTLTQTIQAQSNFQETIWIPPPPVPPDIWPIRKNLTIKLEIQLYLKESTNQIKTDSSGQLYFNYMTT
ncbi:hypothetical protein Pst134EA_022431 [Puccinia striiformis f. sp. tritici]|uniref:Uncharacterized protein n=1 Tax=Puccinia striiformis TaxID=27350 RepID=A0A2S4UNC0_9BASI|nr:hypothetical protein Pst134EA_022431 [Puccinia striiformis f. sp. tritici]KAH9454943.1 hypothetical protein Pst134EA_022431 [Puccinia striiformis f. sp. tritici]KAI9621591.1 hypothetical protein H4Q26_015599 [Puccinia striiformis f. sp. tritici PST-130]POV98604.1 hypothetical protein PSTT_14302 [Puccinia striiformis]